MFWPSFVTYKIRDFLNQLRVNEVYLDISLVTIWDVILLHVARVLYRIVFPLCFLRAAIFKRFVLNIFKYFNIYLF